VAALAEMYVQGFSTRKVRAITEELCGQSFSASAIGAINQRLDASLAQFAGRPLAEAFPYLILDARYERVREAGIPVVRSKSGPLEELPRLLVTADAHLISLRPEFSGIVLPSKVFGCIASRRPVLFVGPVSSDVHVLCRDPGLPAYEHFEVGDLDGYAAAPDRLAQRKQTRTFSSGPRVSGHLQDATIIRSDEARLNS
jgi:hypothetical protein